MYTYFRCSINAWVTTGLALFFIGCDSPTTPSEETSTDVASKPSVFDTEIKRITKSKSPLGATIGWESYDVVMEHPKHDSARYFLAVEKQNNVPQNTAVYQVIYYENGARRTEQSIQPYRKYTHNGVQTYQIEDQNNNTIIFTVEEGKVVANKTGVELTAVIEDENYPLYRTTAGMYLPGGTFERCPDGKIMAFFENEMLQRLNLFMKELVGEKGKSAVVLNGLYTTPDFGEPDLFTITEIKMTDVRSSCIE